jgi:histidyl-tRNA synthetase
MPMFKRPRGTRDFNPAEMALRTGLEQRIDQVCELHGFQRVATPTFETLDLFTAKSGAGVVDQLYAFEDKGGRWLTLRPELTVPVMRMVANEMRNEPKPLRLCYHGSCFRYEESKKGRWREFWQYGAEIIGAAGPLVDAEVIALACAMLEASGVVDWELRIGHVGILRDLLTGIGFSDEPRVGGGGATTTAGGAGVESGAESGAQTGRSGDTGAAEPALASAMRFLDKGDWEGMAALLKSEGLDGSALETLQSVAALSGGVESLRPARMLLSAQEAVTTDNLDELEQTISHLNHLAPGVSNISIDLTVARGLDYYTGIVFEFHLAELGAESQICGGGAYRLMHLFDLPDLDPCCGFGLGFDRVLLALEKQAVRLGRDEILPGAGQHEQRLVVIPFRVDPSLVLPLVASLRARGERVDIELRNRNLGRSMAWANSSGAGAVLIVGPRDVESGQATLKRLSDGEQWTPSLAVESVLAALSESRA